MLAKRLFVTLTALFLASVHVAALAEGPPESGFLQDYSRLQPAEADWLDYIWTSKDYRERIAAAQAVAIPQPELFLAPDSKYKGMKPDDMKVITDSMRQLVVEAFAGGYQIAETAGPNTIVVRMAFSNLYLKKKPRTPLIGYLPQAYIATSAKRALLNDFTENILLTQVVFEAELVEAETGDIVAEMLLKLGSRRDKKEFSSWDELAVALSVGAARLRCRFDNAAVPESEARDCLEIDETDLGLAE